MIINAHIPTDLQLTESTEHQIKLSSHDLISGSCCRPCFESSLSLRFNFPKRFVSNLDEFAEIRRLDDW